jgi:cobaltochelatase CobT
LIGGHYGDSLLYRSGYGVSIEVAADVMRQTPQSGGRSRERWIAAGKPPNPGRLNDLRHIIHKAADALSISG